MSRQSNKEGSVSLSIFRRPYIAAALFIAVLMLVASSPTVSWGQNSNATIRGQVLDPSGALVPGAHIVVVNKNTGTTVFNGHTDSSGSFVAPQVIPGSYKVTATAPGLKQTVIENLVATVSQVTSVNIKMELGGVSEVVTVQSRGEELDRSTSDVSTLIAPQDVQNLPLQGRSVENLLAFIPGVAHGGAADQPSTSQLSINGSRTLNSDMLLNGVSLIEAATGNLQPLPSPDGIDQFRVITSNAPAEYGRTAGAVISVNTISGTNKYHGNAYFLLRNEALDANSYFNKLTINSTTGMGLPRGRDRFFQVGGSLGGPVWIPHIYDGHNKTFFFVNYDKTIQPATTVLSETVPRAAQRTGDLSNALAMVDATGKSRTPQTIYHPGGTSTSAFTGGQVGPIDPAAAKILAILPLPNTIGTYDPVNNRYTGNWTSQQNLTNQILRLVTRVDEQATARDRMSFNIYYYDSPSPQAVVWKNPLINTSQNCNCTSSWITSADYTHVFSSTLVLDLNMGFFRNTGLRNPPGLNMNAAQQLGIPSLPLDEAPQISDPGFSNIGAAVNTDQINITNTYSPYGSITKTIGAHTLKIGASLRKNEFNSFNPSGSPNGAIAFDGSITNHGASGNANTGLADFLLGTIKTGDYQVPMPETGRRNYNFAVFAEDDWKATPKLTINAGLRYEFESPMTVANNIYTRFDPTTGNLLAAGINASRSLNITTPKADFSPRFGLAYSIDEKTVLRAAFGTFYGGIFQNLGGQVAFPGYDVVDSYNNLGTAVAQPFSLSQGLPLTAVRDLSDPFAALKGTSATNPFSISGVAFDDLNPMSLVQQWNAGIERRLPLSLTLEVNYVGNHALHLPYLIPKNIVPLSQADVVTQGNSTAATQNALPFPSIKSFTEVDNVGNSNYNSLQVSVRRQFNTRLAILSNYTFAKSLDDGSTIYNYSAPNGTANAQYTADGPDRARDWAVSNIDAKHTVNIAVIYTTPGPWWLRDWHIAPVFIGNTGLPVNITQTNEIPNVSQQRPNGDPRNLKLAHPTINGPSLQYFDSATDPAFPLTPSGPVYNTINGVRTRIVDAGFGNVPRDSNRSPGEADFDASVSKDFTLYKTLKFQFRIDAFNVINHTNFTLPTTSLTVTESGTSALFSTSSSFGKITGTRSPRTMQASARFSF